MASKRVYSKLALAYSGTKLYVTARQSKSNLATDKDYAPPIVNHPTCVDGTPQVSTITFKIVSVQQKTSNSFEIRVQLSEAITTTFSYAGRLDVVNGNFTTTLAFSGTIQAGSTQGAAIAGSNSTNMIPQRAGILTYNPKSSGSKTITCISNY